MLSFLKYGISFWRKASKRKNDLVDDIPVHRRRPPGATAAACRL